MDGSGRPLCYQKMILLKLLLNLIKFLLTAALTIAALYVISFNFNILGSYKSYAVRSGSMEPTIMTGDIIVVKKQPHYFLGDVVTFRDRRQNVVTHRLIATGEDSTELFSTKGDANRAFDQEKIKEEQIIGRVVFTVPRLGYLMSFTKTPAGLIILVLIPAAIYILDELIKIIKNAKQ